MLTTGFFISGTDTGVGKTWATLSLIRYLQYRNYRVAAMKPIAAGCKLVDHGYQNTDAMLLQQHASVYFPYSIVNAYAFEQAVSPHIACDGKIIDVTIIKDNFKTMSRSADTVLVEGAGGLFSPLDNKINNLDLAIALEIPVILVVGLKLGCINHAMLSWEALRSSSLNCCGWVAQQVDQSMRYIPENIDYLQQNLPIPMLAFLPYIQPIDAQRLAQHWHEFIDKI